MIALWPTPIRVLGFSKLFTGKSESFFAVVYFIDKLWSPRTFDKIPVTGLTSTPPPPTRRIRLDPLAVQIIEP